MHKIGIISDTHNLLRTPVTDMLASCDAILHAGDISSPHILGQLQYAATQTGNGQLPCRPSCQWNYLESESF